MKKKLISDRWEIVKKFVEGKTVLDMGCVDHDASNEGNSEWLHGKICSVAKTAFGVDYLPDEVSHLKEKGYQVIEGNVEDLHLDRQFEVVTAGNIIEHLSNPGRFLDSVHRHLRDDGFFILTTDNCYGLRSLKAMTIYDRIRPNQEHTVTFEEEVLRQLLDRHRFKILDFYYYNGPYPSPIKKFLIDSLCRIRKSWAWQMLVIAQRTANHES